MKRKLPFKALLAMTMLLAGFNQAWSQCSFTGLNASYCANDASVTLTPGTAGGSFSGGGVSAGGVFTPSLAAVGTNTVTYAFCSTTYSVQAGTFAPLPVSGTTLSTSADFSSGGLDDANSGALPVGFNFQFFCNTYSQFYIGTNGYITFTSPTASPFLALPLPQNGTTAPQNAICITWTDLNLGLAPIGNITYTTLGAAPNRKLVVSYNGVAHHNVGAGGFPVTAQAILYETTNVIEIHITSMPPPTSGTTYNCTEGIQNSTGSIAYTVPGRNGTSTWTGTNDMYSFTPGSVCSQSQIVAVNPSSVAITGSTTICSGSTATLTAGSNTTYTWTTASGTSNTPTIALSPTVNTTYSVAGTNSFGCTSNVRTVSITVNNPATITINATNNGSVCLGNTLTLNATGANTYTWANPGVTNNVVFTPSASAVYTVSGTNACGTVQKNITVTVSALPVTAVANQTLICASNPATLTAGGAATFSWTPGVNTNTNFIISPASSTTYTLLGKTGVCSGSATILITTKANPTLNIVPSSTAICLGDAVNLTVVGNATAYVWSNGQTGNSISPSPATLSFFSVVGTNTNNCVSSAGQAVAVNPLPTITASPVNPVICTGGTSTLVALGATTYTWSNNATGASVTASPSGNTTYSVVGSYSTGCVSTAVTNVSIFVPVISVTGSSVICMGAHVTLLANGGDTYTWTNNNSTGPSISVFPTANTVYTLHAQASDANSGISCDANTTFELDVNANPTITATSDRTNNVICLNESAVLTGAGAGASGSYTWTGGAGATVSSTIHVSPIANQSYTITGIDANGCKSSASILITVSTCAGIKTTAANTAELLIYPNPSNGEFTISSNQEITLQISNELGQLVKTISLGGSASALHVNDLSNGVYFISGKNANGSVKQKIMIAK